MRSSGIDLCVAIPDDLSGTDTADLDTLLGIAETHAEVVVVGSPYIFKYSSYEVDRLGALARAGRIKGIKLFPGHDKFYPTDRRCRVFYDLCIKHRLPVIIHTGENPGDLGSCRYNDPNHIVEVARSCPDLTVVISHYFWPRMEYCYDLTKDVANIAYDTSGMADAEVVEKSGGIGAIRDILQKTLLLKPGGVMFGSDWPGCSQGEHLNLIASLDVASDVKERVLSTNALKTFGLDVGR
jgi:predicted TIM-barrel fold metal-dependent hydrolase